MQRSEEFARTGPGYDFPNPICWNTAYGAMTAIWKVQGGNPEARQPVPLILAAWWESTDKEKAGRWERLVEWATANHAEVELGSAVEEGCKEDHCSNDAGKLLARLRHS